MFFLVCMHVWMCVCRHVLYVNNVYHMFQVSTLWMMCDWKIQDGDLCNPDLFWVFFIMCPSCMSIILILLVVFNCMYKGFLDLVWLWCLICSLEHEFVSFNKPYLCFFFFYSWQNDADYEFAQFASKGSCFVWSSNSKYCLGFLVIVQ